MKSTNAIAWLGLLALLGGCSTSVPEPGPGTGSTSPSTTVQTQRFIGHVASDVTATKLYTRPALPVDVQPAWSSRALDPNDVLQDPTPVDVTLSDSLHFAVKGGPATIQVPVDSTSGDAYLFLSPQVNDKDAIQAALADIVVLDPAGVQINKRAKKMSPNEPLAMSAIPLAGHPAGVYTVQFNGSPKVGVAIETRLPVTDIVMKLRPTTHQHLLGGESFVEARLSEGGHPIVGAAITADLLLAEGQISKVTPVTFTEIGDGVYRAAVHGRLGETNMIGAYLADVRAEGTSPSGLKFSRHGRTGFHYAVPTARITAVRNQRTIKDDTGLISAFEVDVDIESASLDRLEISAKLTVVGGDGQEHPIGIAHVGAGYDTGKHTATLRFEASDLRLTNREGNFYLRDVQMFSLGTNSLFHRELAGANLVFPNVSRIALKRAVELTPAQQQLVEEGRLSAD